MKAIPHSADADQAVRVPNARKRKAASRVASAGDAKPQRKVDVLVRAQVLQEIRDRNLLDEKLLRSYEAISLHGPLTGSELDTLLNVGQGPHGHISALRYFGLVEEVGRKLGKSGISASIHDVTDKIPEQRGTWKLYREVSGKGLKVKKGAKDEPTPGRGIWLKIRKELRAYYTPKLLGLDAMTIEHILRAIDVDIATVNAIINNRIAKTLESDAGPSRRKLREACRLLGFRGPGAGRPIDVQLARRKMHKLAREYHPDMNPSGVEMYRRVIDAFGVIESHATSNGKSKKKGDE